METTSKSDPAIYADTTNEKLANTGCRRLQPITDTLSLFSHRGKRQSKESNRACNMFLDFTALSANVRTLTDGPSSQVSFSFTLPCSWSLFLCKLGRSFCADDVMVCGLAVLHVCVHC